MLNVFSGSPGINGYGIAGLVVMALSACAVLASSKLARLFGMRDERGIRIKLAGVIVCALGAVLVIFIGK